MADVLETRLRQAQAETIGPIDLILVLVNDELTRRADQLLEHRRKQAGFRDPDKSLDNFDFAFNPKINRSLIFDLATAAFINKREDVLFVGPGGTGKSHLAQAIGHCAIQQGYKVLYRETHVRRIQPQRIFLHRFPPEWALQGGCALPFIPAADRRSDRIPALPYPPLRSLQD